MDLFVNELSLHRQFSSLAQFVGALKEVIGCRDLADHYRHPFYWIHHSWPIRPDQPLYIAYIGPKITKN